MSTPNMTQPGMTFVPNFEFDESLEPWNLSAIEWLIKNQKRWDGLLTSAIVFDPLGKVLLVQRASHDSMPNRWEVPGGSVDDEDTSLLAAAARELWEEAGLVATRFTRVVSLGPGIKPGRIYTNSRGTRVWCRFAFVVEVKDWDCVRLDPNEHQDFLWATVEEVRAQKVGDRVIPITNEGMSRVILEAFRLRAMKAESL